MILLRPF